MATDSAYLAEQRRKLWEREMFSFIPSRDLPPPDDMAEQGTGQPLVFAGFPSDFSLAFLFALLQRDVRVVGIVTSPGANPAILGDNALSRIAGHLGIPLIRAWRVNDEHTRMQLATLAPDAVVMASFDQIIGRRALEIPKHGWMNVHPSLLPQYRGPEPVYWAIAEGARETGITLHKAVPRVDAGPILAQARVAIDPRDTAGTLTRKLAARGVELLPEALEKLLAGEPGTPPDMSISSYRSSIGHRSLATAATAAEAERLVRAGVPNMLPWAHVGGRDLYVARARVVDGRASNGRHTLRYPDGQLEIIQSSDVCGCHHNMSDCPHRVIEVAGLSKH